MFLALLLATLFAAAAWTYLFLGRRRLPLQPFAEFAALRPRDYDPLARLARLALRAADVATGGRPDAVAIQRAVDHLRQQASDEDRASEAWQRVGEVALDLLAAGRPPAVAIVMAARNEEANLRAALVGLASQAWWPLRVVVCDDQSTDGTAQVLADKGVHVPGLEHFRGADLPAGWSGKNWAIEQGVQRVLGAGAAVAPAGSGAENDGAVLATIGPAGAHPASALPEWLLFVDADVELGADAVYGAVETAERLNLDALSLFPRLDCRTTAEKLMVPFLVHMLSLLFPSDPRVLRPNGQYLGVGMFFLVRRRAYEAVGGHRAIAGQRVEDIALATRLYQAGHPIRWFLSRELARTRMYTGWASVWRGLVKNAYEGMGARPERLIVGLLAAFVLGIAPYVSLLGYGEDGARRTFSDANTAMVATVALAVGSAWAVLASAASLGRVALTQGLAVFWGFTLPISTAVYMAISVASAVQHLGRGGPTWKGRTYGRTGG